MSFLKHYAILSDFTARQFNLFTRESDAVYAVREQVIQFRARSMPDWRSCSIH
jgi:hypothetical protein